MNLLIVRHGVAITRESFQQQYRDGQKDANDAYRPLTLEGISKMQKNARGLKALVRRPDLLVSSPLTRAQQTAEILQQAWDGLELSMNDHLKPSSKPQLLVNWINEHVVSTNESPSVVIVGHEPHLSQFVTWLLEGSGVGSRQNPFIELKKGGACLLEFPHEVAKGSATMKWLATPTFLKSIR